MNLFYMNLLIIKNRVSNNSIFNFLLRTSRVLCVILSISHSTVIHSQTISFRLNHPSSFGKLVDQKQNDSLSTPSSREKVWTGFDGDIIYSHRITPSIEGFLSIGYKTNSSLQYELDFSNNSYSKIEHIIEKKAQDYSIQLGLLTELSANKRFLLQSGGFIVFSKQVEDFVRRDDVFYALDNSLLGTNTSLYYFESPKIFGTGVFIRSNFLLTNNLALFLDYNFSLQYSKYNEESKIITRSTDNLGVLLFEKIERTSQNYSRFYTDNYFTIGVSWNFKRDYLVEKK